VLAAKVSEAGSFVEDELAEAAAAHWKVAAWPVKFLTGTALDEELDEELDVIEKNKDAVSLC